MAGQEEFREGMLLFTIPKQELDLHPGLKRQLVSHAARTGEVDSRYQYVSQVGKLYLFVSLLDEYSVPYLVGANPDPQGSGNNT